MFCTHLLAPQCPLPRAAELSFVTALAVYDAVETTGVPDIALKWPNDLLLAGSKVSGILIESAPGPTGHLEGDPLLAIGIGINITRAPDNTPYPATSLVAHSAEIDAQTLLVRLANSFQRRYEQWDKGHGFAGVRADWLARARGLGGQITVRLQDDVIEGEFLSLDETGALEIRADGNLRKISAGDVFFPDISSRTTD